jgi:hypothetical protein
VSRGQLPRRPEFFPRTEAAGIPVQAIYSAVSSFAK